MNKSDFIGNGRRSQRDLLLKRGQDTHTTSVEKSKVVVVRRGLGNAVDLLRHFWVFFLAAAGTLWPGVYIKMALMA